MRRSEWVSDQVIEEILHDYPSKISERRRKLSDPEWCERHPETVRNFHDPDHMRRVVSVLREVSDPFSYFNLSRKAAELEWRMLNTAQCYRFVMRDPETGEVIDQEPFVNNVDPHSFKAQAYVAELN